MPEQILSGGRQERDRVGTDPGRASVETFKIHTNGISKAN